MLISQVQVVRSGLGLVAYLNQCSWCGQIFAHILWGRHDIRKQSASVCERWYDVGCENPYLGCKGMTYFEEPLL